MKPIVVIDGHQLVLGEELDDEEIITIGFRFVCHDGVCG